MRITLHLISLALAFASLLMIPLEAHSWVSGTTCSEPLRPECLDPYSSLGSKREFDNCRPEVELYISQMKSYIGCLEMEESNKAAKIEDLQRTMKRLQLEKSSKALELKAVVNRFNCKARGGDACP